MAADAGMNVAAVATLLHSSVQNTMTSTTTAVSAIAGQPANTRAARRCWRQTGASIRAASASRRRTGTAYPRAPPEVRR
jgi:hypothetical protein